MEGFQIMAGERIVTATFTEAELYKEAERILDNVNPERELERFDTNPFDYAYHQLARRIFLEGSYSGDRTGTGTIKIPGASLQFDDISEVLPLITSKFTWFKGIKVELDWFLRGGRNIKPLVDQGVNIWNEWAFKWYLQQNGLDENFPTYSDSWKIEMRDFVSRIKSDEDFAEKWGDIGPVYGYQWRHWKTEDGNEIDQFQDAIDTLTHNRYSRRIIISAWNPADINELATRSLPPCHALYQFIVDRDRQTGEEKLNCVMFQRSCDVFLGLPFNIGSYALLTHTVGKLVGIKPGSLTVHLGDTHIYANHFKQVEKQFENESHPPALLKIDTGNRKILRVEDFEVGDFRLIGYKHSGRIAAPISV